MPADTPPGPVLEGGWRPKPLLRTAAEQDLARLIERLLPAASHLLWNVRNDLPAVEMGEILAERMRLLGHAGLWRDIQALEQALAAAKAHEPSC